MCPEVIHNATVFHIYLHPKVVTVWLRHYNWEPCVYERCWNWWSQAASESLPCGICFTSCLVFAQAKVFLLFLGSLLLFCLFFFGSERLLLAVLTCLGANSTGASPQLRHYANSSRESLAPIWVTIHSSQPRRKKHLVAPVQMLFPAVGRRLTLDKLLSLHLLLELLCEAPAFPRGIWHHFVPLS